MKLPKFFWKVVGTLLVLSFFMPIPFGTLRLATGLSILVCASLRFALLIHAGRRKFDGFNRLLTWIEEKLGERWAGNLMVTRPENDPRDHFPSRKKSSNAESPKPTMPTDGSDEKV